MILDALNFVKEELDNFVKRKLQVQGSAVVLNTLVDNAGKVPESNQNKLVVSLVNLKQEQSLRNMPPGPGLAKKSPPFMLEMEVLVSAFFDDYQESLKYISALTSFFHQKGVFTAQNSPGFPSNVEKLYFEVNNLDYSELRSIWSTNGTHYRPSVLYKVRGLLIGEDILLENIPVITGISNK